MARRESDRSWIVGDVVQAQRRRVSDEDAEDAAPARLVADLAARGVVDAGRDEALQTRARRVDDAERRVPGAGQFGRRFDELDRKSVV